MRLMERELRSPLARAYVGDCTVHADYQPERDFVFVDFGETAQVWSESLVNIYVHLFLLH